MSMREERDALDTLMRLVHKKRNLLPDGFTEADYLDFFDSFAIVVEQLLPRLDRWVDSRPRRPKLTLVRPSGHH